MQAVVSSSKLQVYYIFAVTVVVKKRSSVSQILRRKSFFDARRKSLFAKREKLKLALQLAVLMELEL